MKKSTSFNFANGYDENQIINLFKWGEYNKCLQLCDEFISDNPTNKMAIEYKAICLLKTGYYEKAIKIYNGLIELDANFTHYVFRGDCYFKLNSFNESINDYKKALEIDPKLGNCWQKIAEAHFMMGDFAKAHISIDRSIKISNYLRDPWGFKALFYKLEGKLDEANKVFSEIRKKYPDDDLILNQQFEILYNSLNQNKSNN